MVEIYFLAKNSNRTSRCISDTMSRHFENYLGEGPGDEVVTLSNVVSCLLKIKPNSNLRHCRTSVIAKNQFNDENQS